MKEDLPWSAACTLEEYVIELFRQKQTSSPVFQMIVKIYGRDKIEAIWKAYREKQKADKKTTCAPGNPMPPSGS